MLKWTMIFRISLVFLRCFWFEYNQVHCPTVLLRVMGVFRLIRVSSVLCWTTKLKFSDHVTHNIHKTLGRLGVHNGSEVCCRSPPSSILCKNLSFQFLNTVSYCIWKQYLKGETEIIQKLQSTTILYAGYWRAGQSTKYLQQKSLNTCRKSFNSRRTSHCPTHVKPRGVSFPGSTSSLEKEVSPFFVQFYTMASPVSLYYK